MMWWWLLVVPTGWILIAVLLALTTGRGIRIADEMEGTGGSPTGLAEGAAPASDTVPRR